MFTALVIAVALGAAYVTVHWVVPQRAMRAEAVAVEAPDHERRNLA